MPNKKEYLLEVIFNKLKKHSKNINLEKKEFNKFSNLQSDCGHWSPTLGPGYFGALELARNYPAIK